MQCRVLLFHQVQCSTVYCCFVKFSVVASSQVQCSAVQSSVVANSVVKCSAMQCRLSSVVQCSAGWTDGPTAAGHLQLVTRQHHYTLQYTEISTVIYISRYIPIQCHLQLVTDQHHHTAMWYLNYIELRIVTCKHQQTNLIQLPCTEFLSAETKILQYLNTGPYQCMPSLLQVNQKSLNAKRSSTSNYNQFTTVTCNHYTSILQYAVLNQQGLIEFFVQNML